MTALVAAALGAGAAWLTVAPSTRPLKRLTREDDGATRIDSTVVRLLAAAVLAITAAWALGTGGARVTLLAVGGVAVAFVVSRMTTAWRVRLHRTRRQREAREFCDALGAEMRGGLPAAVALERSCEGLPDLSPVVTAARLGGDVAGALRRAGQLPGAEGLRAVAAAWDVAGSSGAALAVVLERVAASLRSDADARAETTAALGPPRATAKMLAVLPLFGLMLGVSMGAHPTDFLLSTPAGLVCLALGVTLALTGVFWVERLAAVAEE